MRVCESMETVMVVA